jgi:exodeoxyribonuclease VII large subunit
VIVVTRGGGSLEDLWEFNEEVVARAILASSIPVVSAVGHEIDFSIADFTADYRAPTPSAAAEILTPDGSDLMERCSSMVARICRESRVILERYRTHQNKIASSGLFLEPLRGVDERRQTIDRHEEVLSTCMGRRIERIVSKLATLSAQLAATHPGQRISNLKEKLDSIAYQIRSNIMRRIDRESDRVRHMQSTLAALSPEATLSRGFSITRNSSGKVITSGQEVSDGDRIETQLAEGSISSVVQTDR